MRTASIATAKAVICVMTLAMMSACRTQSSIGDGVTLYRTSDPFHLGHPAAVVTQLDAPGEIASGTREWTWKGADGRLVGATLHAADSKQRPGDRRWLSQRLVAAEVTVSSSDGIAVHAFSYDSRRAQEGHYFNGFLTANDRDAVVWLISGQKYVTSYRIELREGEPGMEAEATLELLVAYH